MNAKTIAAKQFARGAFGTYKAEIKLYTGITAEISVQVIEL